MNFTAFQSTATSAFNRTVTPQVFAAEIKQAQKVQSLTVSNILQGKTSDAKFVVVKLANGNSATLPASKKAVVGAPITDYMMAETSDNEWIVVTGTSHDTVL